MQIIIITIRIESKNNHKTYLQSHKPLHTKQAHFDFDLTC